MLQEIGQIIITEFSDLKNLDTITTITLRLLVAAILAGILGYERECRSKSAGMRTHMLVAVGTALFIIAPQQNGVSVDDMTRVLQGIIQGIGFLGAGAIITGNARQQAKGLTTAASIWAAAGIGMATGLGMEATAVLSTVIVLFILNILPRVLPVYKNHKPTENPKDNV